MEHSFLYRRMCEILMKRQLTSSNVTPAHHGKVLFVFHFFFFFLHILPLFFFLMVNEYGGLWRAPVSREIKLMAPEQGPNLAIVHQHLYNKNLRGLN